MTYSIGELVLLVIKIILAEQHSNPRQITQEIAERYNVSFRNIWNRLPQEYK